MGGDVPLRLAPGQERGRTLVKGALSASYPLPAAEFRRGASCIPVAAGSIVIAALLSRHSAWMWAHPGYRPLLAVWFTGSLLVSIQWLLSWLDEPLHPTRRQIAYLNALRVVVSLPVYNEDPLILDRTIWALANQSRPPQRIDVVDDGSSVDYTMLKALWEGRCGVTWQRQQNAGKKSAQARTFLSEPAADIIVTVDSDSALEHRALERGLYPFADPHVWSVAGVELAYNAHRNWLTRTVNSRCLFFQVVSCGAQSVVSDVLVNRGPFALYRAQLLREAAPAYLGEMFFGRRIRLGDDAALTLFAQLRGKAVQQSDAFVFSMYPETLSHHFRQWVRWMRGSTVRNCWRIRYLPVRSYGWWFTLASIYLYVISLALPVALATAWPQSARVALWMAGMGIGWMYFSGLRIFAIRRSDESTFTRLLNWLVYPAAILWMTLVLRWLRLWAIGTWFRQGWNTRQQVEVR